MRVCFYGTDEEITRICERPVLALLGPRRTQRVVAFELSDPSISTDPYGAVYRLAADLTEIHREEVNE
ncbi:hypothetical protein [Planomonospora parontospora]|uniref:hypothetical protein n=1 Tax=Planomonospora parontospora TaxID=58119 RepID=UPI0016717117|nr:hypothetical protein [Planomonospora parontospora]GGL22854.1 hypothetical protein GCM10014719_25920 [Planomonospora parontospora subsp. antibiotica]GII14956.1 hypothetical protein Ppa05_16820 [Planomonospora parontospora subsp. antibiotica]